ncbi:MAG: nucleoside deaminase, partial [Muribaculaceae bacterium]|nr:nucleoside deaminase [Muribaculaceae bacterium]
ALRWSQIGRVVYGAPDPRHGYLQAYSAPERAFHPKTEVESGLLAEESLNLIRGFFRRRR